MMPNTRNTSPPTVAPIFIPVFTVSFFMMHLLSAEAVRKYFRIELLFLFTVYHRCRRNFMRGSDIDYPAEKPARSRRRGYNGDPRHQHPHQHGRQHDGPRYDARIERKSEEHAGEFD